MYLGFVDDVIFVHNRPRKCSASRAYTQVTHQQAAVGPKSGFYGSIVITVAVTTFWQVFPLPSNRHRLSYDDCLEDKMEYYQNCSPAHVVQCVRHSDAMCSRA